MRFFQDEIFPGLAPAEWCLHRHVPPWPAWFGKRVWVPYNFMGDYLICIPWPWSQVGPVRSAVTWGLKIIVSHVHHSYQNFLLPLLCVFVSPFPLAGSWNALNPVLCLGPCAWAHSCELCPGWDFFISALHFQCSWWCKMCSSSSLAFFSFCLSAGGIYCLPRSAPCWGQVILS